MVPMFSEEKINRAKVKPIDLPKQDAKKVKGACLFEEPYCNIFIVSRKKSGKTWVIGTILDKCATKDTKVYLFVSTHQKDAAWAEIKKKLDKRNIEYEAYMSIFEGKENFLKPIIEGLNNESKIEEKAIEPSVLSGPMLIRVDDGESKIKDFRPRPLILVDNPSPLLNSSVQAKPEDIKKKNIKNVLPIEVIFVFDDMGSQLRDKYVTQLLKTNRHYKSKVIISSQYLKDMKPEARRQIDYWIMFKGIPDATLKQVHKDADLALDEESFEALYDYATSEPYNFLYIDSNKQEFRRNFNRRIMIKKG